MPKTAPERRESVAAKAKRLERERRARAARLRARLRIGLIAASIAAALLAGAALYRSELLTVERVEVEGLVRLRAEDVIGWAEVPTDATLVRFPGEQVEERLLSRAWILEAHVRRDLPDGMLIRIVERTPVALVDDGTATSWLVDSGGMVMGPRGVEETAALPVIRDVERLTVVPGEVASSTALLNALAVLEGLSPELRSSIRAVSAPTVDKTALYTVDDIEVFVGLAEDMGKKDSLIRRILAEQAGKVVYINVRTVERPTWRGLDDAR